MKKIILFIAGFLYASVAYAASPSSLELSYDLDALTITAQGGHPTQDRFEHFIRRIEIIQNNDEPKIFYFTRQNSPSQFKETIPFDIKAGDNIHLQAYCSYGGVIAGDIVIPEEKKISAMDLKAIRDKEHKNMMIIP